MLYAAGTGPPEAALAAIARAREARRPALLVLDDVDRAPAEVRARAARARPALRRCRRSCSRPGRRRRRSRGSSRARRSCSSRSTPTRVAAIAALLRAGRRATVPVETLLGVEPRRRRAASTRRRASGRGGRRRAASTRLAGRAAAGRTEARALEAELAGSVVDLQSARERARASAATATRDAPVVCPYKGLAAFDADDAEYFFGRERLVAELVAHLVGAPLLAVVGPSGSGKSSVLRAGLLPALAGGVLPGSEHWTQARDPPGRASAARAAAARPSRLAPRVARRARRRPVRGAVHRLRGRGASAREFVAALVRSRARRRRRGAHRARRLLRPLRRLPGALARCSAPTTCSSARCRATSCGARSSARRSVSA